MSASLARAIVEEMNVSSLVTSNHDQEDLIDIESALLYSDEWNSLQNFTCDIVFTFYTSYSFRRSLSC